MKHRGRPSKFIDTTTGDLCTADLDSTQTTQHKPSTQSTTCSDDPSTTTVPPPTYTHSPGPESAAVVGGCSKPPSATRSTSATPPLPAAVEPRSPSPVAASADPPRTSRDSSVEGPPRKPTARKSTSRSGIRVSVFRCGDVFSIRRCNEETMNPDTSSPASTATSPAASSVDSGISQSESADPPPPLVACYLCNFASRSTTGFADHLRRFHTTASSPVAASLRIEILAAGDASTARRCGLCPGYATLSDDEFADHQSAVHGLSALPLVCSVCRSYASLTMTRLHGHFADHHPHASPEFRPLALPYSTHRAADDQSADDHRAAKDVLCTLSPVVGLMDIADMSQREFSDLLDQHAVWFDYW